MTYSPLEERRAFWRATVDECMKLAEALLAMEGPHPELDAVPSVHMTHPARHMEYVERMHDRLEHIMAHPPEQAKELC
jgi:hypothetical protein